MGIKIKLIKLNLQSYANARVSPRSNVTLVWIICPTIFVATPPIFDVYEDNLARMLKGLFNLFS